jgi:NO-binding membrane sensor protein with MHYT domain
MGVAVTAMHYTGMRAAEVSVAAQTVASGHVPSGGATAMAFILPMIVVLGSTLFLTSAFVALSPTGRHARDPGVDEDDEALLPSRSRTLTERQSSHA